MQRIKNCVTLATLETVYNKGVISSAILLLSLFSIVGHVHLR